MTTQTLDKERAIARYSRLSRIIQAGAYSEIPPDGQEDDGSYWYGDVNISEALSDLEDRAAHEGLQFRGKQIEGTWFWKLEPMPEDQQAIFHVTEYVYERFGDLTKDKVDRDFTADELARMSTDRNGYLDCLFKNVEVKETEQEDDTTIWYIRATLAFLCDQGGPIEGTTDIYQAYKGADGQWIVDWHAS